MPKLIRCACGNLHDYRAKRCGKCAGRKAAKAPGVANPPATTAADSFSVAGDRGEVSKLVHEPVRTLADLIRVCEIDLEQWEIERWVCNKWEVGMKEPATGTAPNWSRKSSDPVVVPLFQIKAWLRRKSGITLTLEALRAGLVEDIRAEVKRGAPAIVKHQHVDSGWMFEFSPFDLHMGKYAWSEETVTNYDTDLAADLFNSSLDFLLNRALKVTDGKLERILCVFGNDVSHTDNKRGQTTAGTPLDVDTRFIRVFRRICAVHRRTVDILREIAPVDVKIVPGNHDELSAFHLGEILATRYEDDPRVTVDNSAKLTKYYEFGVNLFGFAHGDAEKVSELPLTMAREMPEAWARCSSREWHIGHKHISEKWEQRARLEQDLYSDKGIRIRRLTSLSAHDYWHTKHKYMDRRACEAFIFHKTAGFTDHLSFNVDHKTGKPMV